MITLIFCICTLVFIHIRIGMSERMWDRRWQGLLDALDEQFKAMSQQSKQEPVYNSGMNKYVNEQPKTRNSKQTNERIQTSESCSHKYKNNIDKLKEFVSKNETELTDLMTVKKETKKDVKKKK